MISELHIEPLIWAKPLTSKKQKFDYPNIYKTPEELKILEDQNQSTIFAPEYERLIRRIQDLSNSISNEAHESESSWGIFSIFKKFKISYKPILLLNSYNNNNDKSFFDNDERADDGTRIVVAFVSTVVAGIGLFLLGRMFNEGADVEEDLESLKDLASTIRNLALADPSHPHLHSIQRIATEAIRITERQKARINYSIYLTTGVIAVAIIGLIGAVLASKVVILAAVVGLVIVGGIQLFKVAYERTDRRDFYSLKRVENDLKDLQASKERIYIT